MLQALQELFTRLAEYLAFLFKVGVVFGIGFAVCYLYLGVSRRKSHGASEPEDLESAITHLHEEINKVDAEVGKLWAKAQMKQQRKMASLARAGEGYQYPGEAGRFAQRFGRLFRRFRGGGGDAAGARADADADTDADTSPLMQRVNDMKRQVSEMKTKLRDVNPFLAATQTGNAPADSARPSAGREPVTTVDAVEDVDRAGEHQASHDPRPDSITISRPHTRGGGSAGGQRASGSQSTGGHPRPGVEAEIVELYNRAVTDPFERERFRERFQAVRVGTVNAVERRQNPTIVPEYKEASDGDFFAYPVGRGEYVVVPSLGLTIEAVGYSAGALGEVFGDTQGHDPQRFYSRYRVRRPALFKCDGDRWQLLSPGELDLGPGD